MRYLFTYGAVPVEEAEKLKLKETEIGWVPESWGIRLLGDLIDIKHGYGFKSEYFGDTGPVLLTPGNFTEYGGLYFNERNLKRYSGDYHSEFVLSHNDLVIVMTDLSRFCKILGNPAFIPDWDKILHNQRIGKIVLKNQELDKRFLYYFFITSEFKEFIKSTATGSTVRHTAPKRILSMRFALPGISEQKKIGLILSGIDRKIDEECKKSEILVILFKTLLNHLMTGEIRVSNFEAGENELRQ